MKNMSLPISDIMLIRQSLKDNISILNTLISCDKQNVDSTEDKYELSCFGELVNMHRKFVEELKEHELKKYKFESLLLDIEEYYKEEGIF